MSSSRQRRADDRGHGSGRSGSLAPVEL